PQVNAVSSKRCCTRPGAVTGNRSASPSGRSAPSASPAAKGGTRHRGGRGPSPLSPPRRPLPAALARLREVEGEVAIRGSGQGSEFDSLREYVPGDDVRVIDWRGPPPRGGGGGP